MFPFLRDFSVMDLSAFARRQHSPWRYPRSVLVSVCGVRASCIQISRDTAKTILLRRCRVRSEIEARSPDSVPCRYHVPFPPFFIFLLKKSGCFTWHSIPALGVVFCCSSWLKKQTLLLRGAVVVGSLCFFPFYKELRAGVGRNREGSFNEASSCQNLCSILTWHKCHVHLGVSQ